MSLTHWLAFLVASNLLLALPGPTVLVVVSYALGHGRRPAAAVVAGVTLGDFTAMTCSMLGLGAILAASAFVFTGLRWLGGLYLIYLGMRAVMARGDGKAAVIGAERPLLNGVLFGLTNPKSYPVAFATFGALVAPYGDHITWAMTPALIGAAFLGFVAADLILFISIGLPPVRRFFSRYGLWVTRIVGMAFIGFGAKSLVEGAKGLATARG